MFKIDLTGQRFGRLVVLSYAGQNKHGFSMWFCKCDCGNTGEFNSNQMKRGKTKSCGCYNIDCIKERSTTHGLTETRIYSIWESMRGRCNDPKDISYHNYGGRGVKVCERWNKSFINFYNDMKDGYSDNLTIDRIDSNKEYCKENCRWATTYKQNNNKRNTYWVTVRGKTASLKEMCDHYKLPYATIWYRLKKGQNVEMAFFTPIDHKKGRRAE